MSSNTKKKIKSWKLFSGIVIVVLLLAVTAAGILYVKIYEPGKRSADLGRLQQESYQGVFCSMYAPEAFPEDIYSTYMGYDAVSCSHRLTSFSDISDYLETAFPPEMRSLTYCSFWIPYGCGTAISIITVDFMPLSMRIFWHMSILIPVLNLP